MLIGDYTSLYTGGDVITLQWLIVAVLGGLYVTAVYRQVGKVVHSNSYVSLAVIMLGLLTIPGVIAALHLPFAQHIVCALYVLLGVGAFLIPSPSKAPFFPLACFSLVFFLMLCVLVYVGGRNHWDNLIAPPLLVMEYVRTGIPNSHWPDGRLDFHNWAVLQQTTSISLDALELFLTGLHTGVASKLYTIVLCFLIFSLLGFEARNVVSRYTYITVALFSLILASYVLENVTLFRPHIYVGLISVAFFLVYGLNHSVFRTASMSVLLVAMFLAKRDGVVVAFMMFLIIVDRRYLLKAAMLAVLAVFLLTSLMRMNGQSVFSHFLSLITIEGFEKFLVTFFQFPELLLCLSFALYLWWATRWKRVPVFLVFLTLMPPVSAVMMEASGQYNLGSISRKVDYFVVPTFLAIGLLLSFRVTKVKMGLVHVMGVGVLFSLMPTAYDRVFTIKGQLDRLSSWTRVVIEEIYFYRDMIPGWESKKIGFFDLDGKSFHASPNRLIDFFHLPIYQAYIGADIAIEKDIDKLRGKDVVVLPHGIGSAYFSEFRRFGYSKSYSLRNGLTLLIKNSLVDQDYSAAALAKIRARPGFFKTYILFADSKVDDILWENKGVISSSHARWDENRLITTASWIGFGSGVALSYNIKVSEGECINSIYFESHDAQHLPGKVVVEDGGGGTLFSSVNFMTGINDLNFKCQANVRLSLYNNSIYNKHYNSPIVVLKNLSVYVKRQYIFDASKE